MATPFLSRFTPSLMDAETLEAVFVQRERLAQRIVETIRENAQTAARSHTLLVGPRGIGKTHLLSLIYYRLLALPGLTDQMRIAWLREEEWGVSSFLDLLLRILRALAESDPTLTPQIESLYSQTQAQATCAARAMLETTLGGQPLLLMAENLDDLFAGLGENGQQAFRSFLQETGLVTILATAQGLFPDISRQSAPFYGFFRVEHLSGLSLDDAVALLTKIAALAEGDTPDESQSLTAYLKTASGRARVRAVHHLAGGNPRVYVIFSEFLTRDSLDALVSPFLKMLDELTPYYQARMQWLSAQQRKIIEILVEVRGAIPVKEIAQRGFMTQQTASSQLKELRNKGYVQSHSIGRESFYELQEPLMRLCLEVKKQRGEPIKLFVEFLRLWCSPPELERRLTMLPADADFTKRCLQEALRLSESSQNPIKAAVLHDLEIALEQYDYPRLLAAAEEMTEIDPLYGRGWFLRGAALFRLGRRKEALPYSQKAVEVDPDDPLYWYGLGVELSRSNELPKAIDAFHRAAEIMPNIVTFLHEYSYALKLAGRYEEALTVFTRLTEIAPANIRYWYERMFLLIGLKHWPESRTALKEAITYHSDQNDVLSLYAIDALSILLVSNPAVWQEQIRPFADIYGQHKAVSILAAVLVQAIPELNSSQISPASRRLWLTTWQEALDGQPEAELPLRMLDTAIRYWESGDPPDARILLELPAEQREILQPLLTQTKETETGTHPGSYLATPPETGGAGE